MTQFEKITLVLKNQFVLVSYIVCMVLIFKFADLPIASYFYKLDLRTQFPLLERLSLLGKDIIYILLFLASAFFFRYLRRDPLNEARSWYMLICLLMASLVCLFIKVLLGRARPELFFTLNLFGFYGLKFNSQYWSFPSGHTTTVFTIVSALSVLFPRCFYGVLLLGLLVVSTRVLLYYHYLSDVLTAVYLNVLLVAWLTQFLKRKDYFNILWKNK